MCDQFTERSVQKNPKVAENVRKAGEIVKRKEESSNKATIVSFAIDTDEELEVLQCGLVVYIPHVYRSRAADDRLLHL